MKYMSHTKDIYPNSKTSLSHNQRQDVQVKEKKQNSEGTRKTTSERNKTGRKQNGIKQLRKSINKTQTGVEGLG